jgi:hypothetical protein
VIAGCAAPVAIKGVNESTVKTGTPTAVAPATADTPVVAQGDPSGADPNTAADNTAVGALDKATTMHMKASAGGVYVSDDGLLKAIFPPGSLSEDTDVRLVRVETSQRKNSDVFLNGIRYQIDLGLAHITPGSSVTISSKADDRLINQLKSMYTDYTPERYALSKDEKGNWNVTMAMHGPVENDAIGVGNGGAAPTRGLMQEGGFPVTIKGGGFHQDARIEAFCNYTPPPKPAYYGNFEAHVTWESDVASGLAGLPATEPYSGNSSKDSRVWVDFSTNYVNAALPPRFTITQAAVAAVPEVDTDQYGNVVRNAAGQLPAGSMAAQVQTALDAKAASGAFVDFCGRVVTSSGHWNQPGNPPASVQCDLPATNSSTPAAATRQILIPAVSATGEIAVPAPVAGPGAGGAYVTGGNQWDPVMRCLCGPYVVSLPSSVISGPTRRLTDASGVARISALQSFNSQNCNRGFCAGGPTYFTIFSQAKYTFPRQQPEADNFMGGDIFGASSSVVSALTGPGVPAVPSNGTPYGPANLTLAKYSPFIKLNLTNSKGFAYSGDVTMTYHINGGAARTMTFTGLSGRGTNLESFFVPGIKAGAPDITWADDIQTLKIDEIRVTNNTVAASSNDRTPADGNPLDIKRYQAFPIQRGNVYTLTVDMLQTGAK